MSKCSFELQGRLGNQLFQYSFGMAYSAANHMVPRFVYDGTVEQQMSDLRAMYLPFPLIRMDGSSRIRSTLSSFGRYFAPVSWRYFGEDKYKRDSVKVFKSGRRHYKGYLQYPELIEAQRLILQGVFWPRVELSPYCSKIASDMLRTSSVAIHVRRGDYASPTVARVLQSLDVEYYRAAVDLVRRRVKSPEFYVFSDDYSFARGHLSFIKGEVTFIDSNKTSALEDFYLMRKAKHWVIANSTFSWWPAWLSKHDESLIVMPEEWFADGRPNHFGYPGTISI
jgi:hypothetical protein